MTAQTIAQKVEKELQGKKAEEITSLDLSGCTGDSFEGLTDKFVNLKEIIANGCGLKSCDGIPVLKNLLSLDLSNNQIADLKAIAALPSLTILNLVNNKIDKVEVMEVLFNHPKLECINLEGNEVREQEGFLDKLFANLPFLVAVDGVNNPNGSTFVENGEDYEDDEEYDSEASDSEDEDVGLEDLQRSGELEDDEDDYNPEGEEDEEEEFDEEDDEEGDENGVDEDDSNHVDVEEKAGKKRKAEANGSADAKVKRVSGANGDAE